jgi:hypothetical protein
MEDQHGALIRGNPGKCLFQDESKFVAVHLVRRIIAINSLETLEASANFMAASARLTSSQMETAICHKLMRASWTASRAASSSPRMRRAIEKTWQSNGRVTSARSMRDAISSVDELADSLRESNRFLVKVTGAAHEPSDFWFYRKSQTLPGMTRRSHDFVIVPTKSDAHFPQTLVRLDTSTW